MVRAKKKYYVVFLGRVPGIYSSWPACHSQVNEFSGNLHKSYETFDEARLAFEQFVSANQLQTQLTNNGSLVHPMHATSIRHNPSQIPDQLLPFDQGIQEQRQIEGGDNHSTVGQSNRSNQSCCQQNPYHFILFIFVTILVLFLTLVRW